MAKKHRSVSAAQKAGSLYFYDKNGTKKLAVTAEQLNAWKKKNKGKYKGSALTAWANNKGKDVGEKGPAKVRPKLRPKPDAKGPVRRGDGTEAGVKKTKFGPPGSARPAPKPMNKGGMAKKSGYMGGGMTKKKVMTYNMGGMVKSQVNNLKKGRS